MKKKHTVKTAQIRKKLSRRMEMARRSAFRMTPREEEVHLIVDGNSSRVCCTRSRSLALAVLEDTGALDLRYPDNANHPHQAYHTNDSSKSRFK